MFAPSATVSRRTTTFGGYRRDTETATTERRSIATGGVRLVEALHERSRRGIMDGPRRLIKADNHRVGRLRQGTRSLKDQEPNFSEAFPEAASGKGQMS